MSRVRMGECQLACTAVPEQGNDLVPSGKKNRNGEDIVKPESVIDYNKAKKGIDVATYTMPTTRHYENQGSGTGSWFWK